MFTSLTLFALLQEPLTSFVTSLSSFVGSAGCFARIQSFLETEVRIDGREAEGGSICRDSPMPKFPRRTLVGVDWPEQDAALVKETPATGFSDMNAITVKTGTFGYDTSQEPVLTRINAKVPQGKFTMLVGPVGSGKSTLLKAFLGEVKIMAGSIHTSSPEVAYCDQTPWHMNGTIRDSILAFSPVDGKWYNQVLEICALKQDLAQLPEGDLTMIGSKGIVLSGGQSQRIVGQPLSALDGLQSLG